MRIVFLGLSITSSWGNGHATNYRALVRALAARGHEVLFLERDVPWYAENRDAPAPPGCRTELYESLDELHDRFTEDIAGADLAVVGSYVPEGVEVATWVLATARGAIAFYDIDTPVTVAALERGDCEYLAPELVREFDLYLSFTGGPLLDRIAREYGARRPRAFYCLVDPDLYFPCLSNHEFDLGYLGTYGADRQSTLDRLLLAPARALPAMRFAVAGPQYPEEIEWPRNVTRIEHLPPSEHRSFYAMQRFTLNVTRRDMVLAGWSPSVRLFEAAACAVPVISDWWDGLDSFFRPGREILVASSGQEVVDLLRGLSPDEAHEIGKAARRRVLAAHTAEHRAAELERHVAELAGARVA